MKVSKLVCQCDGLGDAARPDLPSWMGTSSSCWNSLRQSVPAGTAPLQGVLVQGHALPGPSPPCGWWNQEYESQATWAQVGPLCEQGLLWGRLRLSLRLLHSSTSLPNPVSFPSLVQCCWPQGHVLTNSLPAKLCLRICFQENLTCSTQTFGLPLAVGLVGI